MREPSPRVTQVLCGQDGFNNLRRRGRVSQPVDPDDHQLLPEDEDSDLRYDHRTSGDDADDLDADEGDE